MGERSAYDTDWETVAASQTDQVIGPSGAAGNILHRIIASVATSATGALSIKDGAGGAISIIPPNSPVGPYSIEIGAMSTSGAWKVTTGAGVTCVAVGSFT